MKNLIFFDHTGLYLKGRWYEHHHHLTLSVKTFDYFNWILGSEGVRHSSATPIAPIPTYIHNPNTDLTLTAKIQKLFLRFLRVKFREV